MRRTGHNWPIPLSGHRIVVVGSCPDALAPAFRALTANARTSHHLDPDLVICFPDSGRITGLARLISEYAARWPVVVVAHRDWPHATTVLAAGAHLYLVWEDSDVGLDLIRLISALVPPQRPAAGDPTAAPLDRLSHRERETLSYIAAGYTHQQTARRMCVAKATVDTFVERIKTKLGVRNKAELTRLALGTPLR